jgi:MarR family transcriptional regulator for hemolysin
MLEETATMDAADGHDEASSMKGCSPAPESSESTLEARRHIGLRFTIIARMLRNNFDRQVVKLSVTRSQWAMIAVVSRSPGATQRTIAESLEMSEASAGRLIDRLCADGLLERRDRRDDRRARAVFLTPAAEPLLEQLATIARASEQRMFKGFNEEELESLGNFLNRIYDNVSRG